MGERLNTQGLIDLLVKNQGLDKKKVESFTKEFFSLIEEGLERNKSVKIKGFGTFKLVDVDNRESVNVNTGERIEIQGHTKIAFIPDATLKDIINKPFAHFETVVLNDDVDFNQIEEETDDINEWGETKTGEVSDDATLPLNEIVGKPEIIDVETRPQTRTTLKEKEGKENKTIKKNSNTILIIIVLLAILSCGALLFFMYYDDIISPKPKQQITTQPVAKDSIKEDHVTDSIAVKDSIEQQSSQDSTPEKAKTTETSDRSGLTSPNRNRTVPFSKIPVNPDSTGYEIIGTKTVHTIKDGETLIRLSYRYYGSKDLFPYIIKHNSSRIKNPNNVPMGTVVNIPELKKK